MSDGVFGKWLLLCLVALISLPVCASAGVPPMINYQGKLTQPSGAPVPDGTYQMAFAIYGVATGGTALWSETNTSVQVKSGLFSTLLGSVVNLPANIFDSPNRWFGVSVGADPEMSPRQQIASSAFAVKSSVSDTVIDGAITGEKLADSAVTSGKIAAGGVGNSNLAAAAVTGDKVASSTITGDKLASGTITADKLATGVAIPAGTILMWSGAVGSIPSGWALCNGSNGTPDLRDRFIVGAGTTYAVGATGGAATVTLAVAQMPAHTHSERLREVAAGTGGWVIAKNYTTPWETWDNISTEGGGQAHENRPPYYALCYIMKLAY